MFIIPKILHQTFISNKLPREIQKTIKHNKQQNSTFDYRFYQDDDCIDSTIQCIHYIVKNIIVSIMNRYTNRYKDLNFFL